MTALEPRDAEVTAALVETTVDEPAEGVLGRTYRALSIGIVSVVLLIAFEATAVGTAMPVAARELHGIPLYAFAFSAYFTTSLFAMVLSGQWADRRGPLAPLATGIGAFGAGLLLSGTAGGMWMFILGRAVQGVGGGLVIVALYVVIGRAYPERIRPSIMAAFSAAWIVPSVVGPLASGTVTEHLGWRWVFVGIPVLILLPLGLALPAIRRMAGGPTDADAAAEPFDGRRIRLALGISAGAGLLQYAGQELRWLSLVCGTGRCRAARPRRTRAAAPGDPAGRAGSARRDPAAGHVVRLLHRRRVLRPADARDAAGPVPDPGKPLPGRGRS